MLTADQIALAAHLNSIKTRTLNWVAEDPDNRWACYPVQEVEFWAEQGINSVADYQRSATIENIIDTYKEIHGIKPRWMSFDNMTQEELDSYLDGLYSAAKAEIDREEAEEKATAAKVGVDLETYRRWMQQEEDREMTDYYANFENQEAARTPQLREYAEIYS